MKKEGVVEKNEWHGNRLPREVFSYKNGGREAEDGHFFFFSHCRFKRRKMWWKALWSLPDCYERSLLQIRELWFRERERNTSMGLQHKENGTILDLMQLDSQSKPQWQERRPLRPAKAPHGLTWCVSERNLCSELPLTCAGPKARV